LSMLSETSFSTGVTPNAFDRCSTRRITIGSRLSQ
jgi:hypothetical protein